MTPERLQEIREYLDGTDFRHMETDEHEALMQELLAEVDRLTEANATACGEWQGWLDAADAAGWQYDRQGDRERLRRCRR